MSDSVKFHEPVKRPYARRSRFRGPLYGCTIKEIHAWDKCKECRAIYQRRYRQAVKLASARSQQR